MFRSKSAVDDPNRDRPNPTRLRLARKRRGFTQTAFATKIGVIRRAVVAYEAGAYPPAPDTLERIANVLGFPIEFFFGDDLDMPCLDTGSFRSMSKMTAVQREMALGQAAIGLYFSQWLDGRFDLPKADFPDLSREPNPEAAAESLRRAWGLGTLSIRNMIHLLESKGVRVFSLALDAREVDAFSMWKGATPFVFLNTQKSSAHSRFDAAHELGHLVLHKHGPPQGREAEKQATEFASAFLMPRGSVLAHRPKFPTYPVIVKLKKVWATSASAVSYRLHELDMLSDWQYRGLCIEIAKRGRHVEPEPIPRETSQILQKTFSLLYREGLTRTKIAQALSLPVSELEQLLFGLALASIEGGNQNTSQSLRSELRRLK